MQRGRGQDALPPGTQGDERSGREGERMSDQDEELQLAALQRQLDDAFATTRPRSGFEDELWSRMQAKRPAGTRLRDTWLGLVQGIRAAPAVPTAAVAALLGGSLCAGVLTMSGVGRGASTASSRGAPYLSSGADNSAVAKGPFGKLPAPSLNFGPPTKAGDGYSSTAPGTSATATGGNYYS